MPVADPAAALDAIDASCGVVDLDVAHPIPAVADIGPLGARCLVRFAGRPVGYVDLVGAPSLDAAALAAEIWTALGEEIARRAADVGIRGLRSLPAAGVPVPRCDDHEAEVAPRVTVVIATKDRPDDLARCLDSILAARPRPAHVIVVDNAPSDGRTQDLVARRAAAGEPVQHVLEPTPGLGRAHNAALPWVTTDLVAFTDDDVLVDPGWVGAIEAAFAAGPRVACVTGLIAPVELRTREQWWVERSSGFAKGFVQRVRSLERTDDEGPLFPFDAGTLGSGANMAFTTSFLRAEGGFDPALGTGTRSLGGDDLEALHRVVASGHDLVYEPSAIVFHRHRPDRAGLDRQAVGYGAGLTAYLTATIVRTPRSAPQLLRRSVPGVRRALGASSPLNARRPADYPAALVWRERAGMASGPVRYLWQRTKERAA